MKDILSRPKGLTLLIMLCGLPVADAQEPLPSLSLPADFMLEAPATGAFRNLTLAEAIRLALANNLGAKVEKLQETIEDARVSGRKAEFHPVFSVSGLYESIEKPQNTREFVATQSALNPRTSRIFEEENYRFKTAIKGKTPLGS